MSNFTLVPQKPYLGIDDLAKEHVSINYKLLLLGQFFNKLATTLSSTKIVLPWLLSSVGAPNFLSGLLVPIRESGSMLPQVFIGGKLQSQSIRKVWFVRGILLQALCIALMVITTLLLSGTAAGVLIVGLLTLLSLARGVCSLCSKDLLGKTVPKSNRGRLLGLSASFAGLVTICFGLSISVGLLTIAGEYWLLTIATCCALCTAVCFSQLREFEGETAAASNAKTQLRKSLELVTEDKVFRRFVLVRALMMSSSLAAPYFILLAQQSSVDSSIKSLSLFIVVSGIASFISSFVWGRFADKSSRQVLLITSILTSALCLATAALNWLQIEISVAGPLALFFLLSVTHQGVRLGRKTYVIDIADGNQRTQYVATSNSVIGALLLVIGLLGALASQLSISLVLLMFAGMALTALCLGMSLPEVSSRRSSDEN